VALNGRGISAAFDAVMGVAGLSIASELAPGGGCDAIAKPSVG
jgi:hypothetical protein